MKDIKDWLGLVGDNAATKLMLRRLSDENGHELSYQMEGMEGRYRCILQLPDRALRHLPDLSKNEFLGKVCDSAREAENSAAEAFWDDPIVQEIAQNLEPSKKAQRQIKRCAERRAQRDAKRKTHIR